MLRKKIIALVAVLTLVVQCVPSAFAVSGGLVPVPDNVERAEVSAENESLLQQNTKDIPSLLALGNQHFYVQQVLLFPAYTDSLGETYYHPNHYAIKTGSQTTLWLNLSPDDTTDLINGFSALGNQANSWFLVVLCNSINFDRPLYYLYQPGIDFQYGAEERYNVSTNQQTEFRYIFPMLDKTERYFMSVTGGFHYLANGKDVNYGFQGGAYVYK